MSTHFDLAIIGTGSGNSIVDERFADRQVAILEKGTFGGTCLNVGLHPHQDVRLPRRPRPDAAAHGPRPRRRDPVRRGPLARDPRPDLRPDRPDLRSAAASWRADSNANVTLFEGHARFVDARTLDTGTGRDDHRRPGRDRGGRPARASPTIEGLDDGRLPHQRHRDAARRRCPSGCSIIGGGFVAAEFAHVFGSFGTPGDDREPLGRRCCAPRTTTISRRVHRDRPGPLGRAARHRGRPRSRRTTDGRPRPPLRRQHASTWTAAGRDRPARQLRRPRPRPHRRRGRRRRPRRGRRAPAHQRRGHLGARRRRATTSSSSTSRTTRPGSSSTTCCTPTTSWQSRPRRGAERGVLQPAGRQRRAHRAGRPSSRACGTWSARQRLRRHGLRLGDGGHHRLRQAGRRPRHRADPGRALPRRRRPRT